MAKEYDSSVKQNKGKPPAYQGFSAYFPRAVREVAKVSEFGRSKYGASWEDQNWRKIAVGDLLDSVQRHLLDRAIQGEVNHEDGGCLHLAQVAWEAMAALEVHLQQQEDVPHIGELNT